MDGEAVADGRMTAPGAPGPQDEAQLIARIRARDLRAFESLYRRYHPRLTRFLTNLIHRPQMVEEVLNDTLLVVCTVNPHVAQEATVFLDLEALGIPAGSQFVTCPLRQVAADNECTRVEAGTLQRSGMIRYQRGRVHIVNREGLTDAACECYAITRKLVDDLYSNPFTTQ